MVPLILHERLLGFIVLAKSKGNIELNWEVNDLLKTAGMQAASYLAQLEAAKALLVARQFESFNRMSAFVVHDLKNLIVAAFAAACQTPISIEIILSFRKT